MRGAFFRDQVLAAREQGYRVGVVAPEVVGARAFLRRPGSSLATRREEDAGVRTYRKTAVPLLPRFPRRNAWFWIRAGKQLFADYVEREGLPDLIHAHGVLYGGLLARQIGERHGIPYVITEHSSMFATGRARRWMAKEADRAFASAATRLVVSPHLGAILTARFSGSFCPWQSVPNTLDRVFERPLDDDKASGVQAHFTFLCVAALRRLKGQELLIAAFARQFGGDQSVSLRLVGEGPMESAYRRAAEEYGVSDRVTFVGALDREAVRREMLAADAFVLPTYYDTFGVVVIEALACGIPAIVTTGSGPESIVDAGNGLLVPPGDVDALAAALSEMRQTRGRYDSASLRKTCLDRYSQAAVARRLAAVYDVILWDRQIGGSDRSNRPHRGGA